MFSVAIVLSLCNWFSCFLSYGIVDSFEREMLRLIDLVRWAFFDDYYLYLVATFLCGSLPLLVGFLGFIRPDSKILLVVSLIASLVVGISVIFVCWDTLSVLNIRYHNIIVELGIGIYISGGIFLIEIIAGFIARRQAIAQLPS